MDTIRDTAASFCITLMIGGIFSMLLPSGSWNRYAKMGVRLFLLLCLVMPFAGGKVDFSLENGHYETPAIVSEDWEGLMEKQLLESFSENLKREADRLLQEHGIAAQEIEFGIHIADEQRIDITNIRITLEPGMDASVQKAGTLIAEAFEKTPEILVAGQGGAGNG